MKERLRCGLSHNTIPEERDNSPQTTGHRTPSFFVSARRGSTWVCGNLQPWPSINKDRVGHLN
jgi:hypothetical protein